MSAPDPAPKGDELLEQYRKWVEMIRFLADDPRVPERALRSAIKWIAVDQRLTPADIARTHELARMYGWKLDHETPCEHQWVVEAGYGPRGHGASWCSKCGIPNPEGFMTGPPDPAVVPPLNALLMQLGALVVRLRHPHARFREAPAGLDAVSSATVDNWADELEALVAALRAQLVAVSAIDPVVLAPHSPSTRDGGSSFSSTSSEVAGVRAGAPASEPDDLRTAAADLVHALGYYGFSYNRDIVKQKLAALAQALEAESQ